VNTYLVFSAFTSLLEASKSFCVILCITFLNQTQKQMKEKKYMTQMGGGGGGKRNVYRSM
jgi:hypothetical protein